jgi:hypothetical protein
LGQEALGQSHRDTLQAIYDLAITWESQSRRDDAIALMDECLQMGRSMLGPDDLFIRHLSRAFDGWTNE